MQILVILRATFPVLFSPRFWGLVGTAFFALAETKAWFDPAWMEFLKTVFGFGTGIGVADWLIKKTKTTS